MTETKRSVLIQLMGYPELVGDEDYYMGEIYPDWDAVLERLATHPEEAFATEVLESDSHAYYPLDDALWITYDPVPAKVVIRLLRLCPEALTEKTFEFAENNKYLNPEVMKLLRASDVNYSHAKKRSKLVQLIGYPPYANDDDYDQENVHPDWEGVRMRLLSNPEEAETPEGEWYPLTDALWIQNNPVPVDIVTTLMRIAPKALTDLAFETASENESLDPAVLRHMFAFDNEQRTATICDDDDEGEIVVQPADSFVNVEAKVVDE